MLKKSSSLTEIKGIGDKTTKYYEKLGIRNVGELLHYLPKKYDTFEDSIPIAKLKSSEICAVTGTVVGIPQQKKVKNLSILTFLIRDLTGSLQLVYFNSPFLQKVLKPGQTYTFRGKVSVRGAAFVMEHPAYYFPEEYRKLTGVLQPQYSLTKGLTNGALQKSIQKALSEYQPEDEYLSEQERKKLSFMPEKEALQKIHFPQTLEQAIAARERFVFEEFLFFLILLRKNKDLANALPNEYQMTETADTIHYVKSLPYELTKGQKRTWQEIREDLEGKKCMNRLVQGDVGSGKTVIATLALLMTVCNGYQGALMAPTEVLATQHFEGIRKDTERYGLSFRPILLVGSMSAKEKKEAREKIASGEANLIIGTHALIQEKVKYQNLALVVTDEQHRFGVRQRENLAEKGLHPHVLVMSATPIPRTLAIILYGDLQISLIKELPAERLPIKNCVVGISYRPKAYQFIEKQVSLGHQAYVICPQVEEGEMEDLENVVEYAQKLKDALPASIRVEYLHGKMRPSEKTRIMTDFAQKNIDVLVSTTVIEVGINVPNATVMMVENAERFGLAQLHQLRGRVGRGEAQSYCIFLSTNDTKETMERLDILNHSNDGFLIAQEDLKLRGPGDIFGIRQSGDFVFRIGDVYQDAEILKKASEYANLLLDQDPNLAKPEHVLLRERLENASKEMVDFRTI